MIHIMHLDKENFDAIKSGEKKYEYRLYDEKRRKVELHDQVVFLNAEDESQQMEFVIGDIISGKSFSSLRSKMFREAKINYGDLDSTLMLTYYSMDQQKKYGVVAFRLDPPGLSNPARTAENDYCMNHHETPVMAVARYLLQTQRETLFPDGSCISQERLYHLDIHTAAGKLKRIYSDSAIVSMAFFISFCRDEMTKEEYEQKMKAYLPGNLNATDVADMLEGAKKLTFQMYSVLSEEERMKREERRAEFLKGNDNES